MTPKHEFEDNLLDDGSEENETENIELSDIVFQTKLGDELKSEIRDITSTEK